METTGMIHITKAGTGDISALQQISRKTFYETFAADNTEADMQQYLTGNFSTESLAAELSDPDSAFYFATHNGDIIGYLKINTGAAQTEPQTDALEIERIYVLKEYYGKNAGQLLYEKAVSLAHEMQLSSLWLGVWEHNARAIRFYEKNGFTAFGSHSFFLGNDEQTDILMRKKPD